MRLSWGGRQVLALLLLAVILVLISGLNQLTSVIRLATEDATTQCGLVSQSLVKAIDRRLRDRPDDPLRDLEQDGRIEQAIEVAASHAPSVAWVALCDSTGIALVHSNAAQVGTLLGYSPALPQPRSTLEATRVLLSLRRPAFTYAVDRALRIGDRPFLTIRVGVGDALLRARVAEAFRRGMFAALVQLALAIGLGFLLSRFMAARLRMLEAGVQAIREGRFEERIPETGADEFRRLARDLNLLSEQFQRERGASSVRSASGAPAGTPPMGGIGGSGDAGGSAKPGASEETQAGGTTESSGEPRRSAEILGHALIAVGPDGRVVVANDEAARILGLEAGPLVGRKLEDRLPSGHPLLRLLDEVLRDERRSVVAALGETQRVAVAHRVPGTRAVLLELKWKWEQEELHALVDQSRVVSRLAQMATGVAHEIGNPLAAITLELETLRDAHELSDAEIQSHVTTASQKVQLVQRAISGFLTVARLRRPTPTRFDLAELLEEVATNRQSDADLAGLELVVTAPVEPIEIEADRQVLLQALENLTRNAIQAGQSREGQIHLRCSADAGHARLEVEDTGPGIPAENRELVFQLYFTTKRGGTGVGLALVRQAVELHGGTVELESDVGRGSRFILSLPISAPGI